MTPFAIAGIRMCLTTGDNIEAMRHRSDPTMHLDPWAQMAMFSELACFGPLPGEAEAAFQKTAERHRIRPLRRSVLE
jgi:hypothetical protein